MLLTKISHISLLLLFSAVHLACTDKKETTGAASETLSSSVGATGDTTTEQGPDSDWALGSYYQPIYTNYAAIEKPSISILDGFTATLEDEFCGAGSVQYKPLRWQALDENQIEFSSMVDGDPVMWFSQKAFSVIRMRRTDDPEIVIVSDGDNEEGITLGKFRRGVGCLQVTDMSLGCNGGSFVVPCDDVTGG